MFSTPFTFMKAASGGTPSLPAGYTFYVDASDSASYPGTGTTWFDLSGNGYDFTLSNASAFVNNGGNDKYMDFNTYGSKRIVSGSLSNVPNGTQGTFVTYGAIRNTGGDWRTVIRDGDVFDNLHQVIIADGTYDVGLYHNGFWASGYSASAIAGSNHLMAFKFSANPDPYWQLYLDSGTSTPVGTVSSPAAATVDAGFASLGCWHGDSSDPAIVSQFWGTMYIALYYPYWLSQSELDQINDYIAYRYP